MKRDLLKGKNILVMGLGKFGGGLDCAKFAAACADSKVVVADMATADKLADAISELKSFDNIEFHLGEHSESDFADADIVIVNPAVPRNSRFFKIAQDNGAAITSQMGIFFDNCPAKIIGITGANGKSTTTKLTWHILNFASQNNQFGFCKVWLGGNIGNMPLLSELEKISPRDLIVLEVSSFQAEQLADEDLAPDISLITNITPNHLDRHGTFEAYCLAKESLFLLQKSGNYGKPVSIFNAEDEITAAWFEKYNRDDQRKCKLFNSYDVPDFVKANFPLPGKVNISNLAAAISVADCFGISSHIIADAVKSFKGLPHRLELVATGGGVRWYNDSIATTPPSTIAALEAFNEPIILIAGGYDKKLPFDEMGRLAAGKLKAAVLIGTTAEKIKEAIEAGGGDCPISIENTFQEAIEKANRISSRGDIILLSPACASYDMFDNFQQRGDIFRRAAQQLCSKKD